MIQSAEGFGFKVYYGDGTRLDVLHASGAATAQAIAVCVDDKDAALKIVELAQHSFPHEKLLVRAQDNQVIAMVLAMRLQQQPCIAFPEYEARLLTPSRRQQRAGKEHIGLLLRLLQACILVERPFIHRREQGAGWQRVEDAQTGLGKRPPDHSSACLDAREKSLATTRFA